ncbi:MAG: glycosyltransferase family 2 protein [Muribaculaceae bacterium]
MRFSLVICVYNVARFIEKSLTDVLRQGFHEIIIVDDGSTDGITPAICDRFAASDSRINVIHKPNGGLGSARNAGIEAATGDYITFYDVDDIIHDNAIATISLLLGKKSVDILMFGYNEINPALNVSTPFSFSDMTLTGDDIRENFVEHLSGMRFNNGFAWNKVYRLSFLNDHNLRFGNQAIQQDMPFNLRAYRHARSICLCSNILYDYYVYNTGNNRSRFIADRLAIYRSIYKEFRDLLNEWNITDSRIETYICRKFLNDVVSTLTYDLFHKDCPMNCNEKREYISEVLCSEDVKQASKSLSSYGYKYTDSQERRYFQAIAKCDTGAFLRARRLNEIRNYFSRIYHFILR